MERIVKKAKSVRVKLFLILCLVVLSIIAFLILVNSFVLEKYYQYTKSNNLKREEKSLLEKKEETVEHTSLLERNYKQEQQTKDAANIASEAKSQNDDWEKLILEAFK